MPVDERLYTLRAACEQRIIECDAWLKRKPADMDAALRRRGFARMAARFHAKIERLEYAETETSRL